MVELPATKPLEWIGNTRRVVQGFAKPVRQVVGQALYAAQIGDTHIDTKPLKGFGGAAVVEIIADYDGPAGAFEQKPTVSCVVLRSEADISDRNPPRSPR